MTTKAWSIIDQLAQDKLQEARENVSLANQALQKVTAQKLQLFEMLNDYQSRLNKSQETKHSIDEHVSFRHFIKQVQDLIEVIEKEEHQAVQAEGLVEGHSPPRDRPESGDDSTWRQAAIGTTSSTFPAEVLRKPFSSWRVLWRTVFWRWGFWRWFFCWRTVWQTMA